MEANHPTPVQVLGTAIEISGIKDMDKIILEDNVFFQVSESVVVHQ